MFKNVSKETITRTVILLIALVNNALNMLGKNPLPFSDNEIYSVISNIFTIAASIWAWWKNNSFTQAAIEGDKLKDELKAKAKEEKNEATDEEKNNKKEE